jgi:hypothetical protein
VLGTTRAHPPEVCRARRLFVFTLTLLIGAALAPRPRLPLPSFAIPDWSGITARAQDESLKSLSEEYAQLERESLTDDNYRRLTYLTLLKFLPPGTRMTSGYRSPEKQLNLILRMARQKGFAAPTQASIEDENSWRPAFTYLRSKGILIAIPTTTPHARDEAVFDLSGPSIDAIKAGLDHAEKTGEVVFKRILFERQNNAVHVEVKYIDPKLMRVLGSRAAPGGAVTGGPAGAGASNDSGSGAGREEILQQFRNLHDAEPDPEKKIDYDQSQISLLDPNADASRIESLNAEIERHRQEAQQLSQDTRKKQSIEDVSAALRDERFDDAEAAAGFLAKTYPDLPEVRGMMAQVRTRRLIKGAADALYESDAPGCAECERAGRLLDKALELSPDYEGAQFIKEDLDVCVARCRSKRLRVAGLLSLLPIGLGVGLYFFARSKGWHATVGSTARGALDGVLRVPGLSPKGWALECVEGPCRGQSFPLEKGEIVVGAKAGADSADIVIIDERRKISRRHCTIMQDGKRFYLIDESTNGTHLNGQRIARGALVEFRQGDLISLAEEAVLVLRAR